MLVLTRKETERVVISGGLTVEVIVKRIKKNQVQLVFVAPPEVKIMRGELLERNNGTGEPRESAPPSPVSQPRSDP